MVSFNRIQAQLVKTDSAFANICIEDVKSLARILKHDEQIVTCLRGVLSGSTALLCATDKRLLMVRTKNQTSHIDEVSYETIQQTQQYDRRWSSFITITTEDMNYDFKSWRRRQSKEVHSFVVRHSEHVKLLLEKSEANFVVPKKFAHYTRLRSMRALGDTALVKQ